MLLIDFSHALLLKMHAWSKGVCPWACPDITCVTSISALSTSTPHRPHLSHGQKCLGHGKWWPNLIATLMARQEAFNYLLMSLSLSPSLPLSLSPPLPLPPSPWISLDPTGQSSNGQHNQAMWQCHSTGIIQRLWERDQPTLQRLPW